MWTFSKNAFFLKEDNRYRVKKGMKFYRVKIQLLKVPSRKRDTSISDNLNVPVTFVQWQSNNILVSSFDQFNPQFNWIILK